MVWSGQRSGWYVHISMNVVHAGTSTRMTGTFLHVPRPLIIAPKIHPQFFTVCSVKLLFFLGGGGGCIYVIHFLAFVPYNSMVCSFASIKTRQVYNLFQ